MNWLLSNFGVVVFVIVVISMIRAALKAARISQEHQAGTSETEEQRRVREIQERIRRKIAERRGEVAPPEMAAPTGDAPVEREFVPPVLSRPSTAPLDPFGGPSARRVIVEQMERRVRQLQPAPTVEQMSAAIERQEQLAEEMRVLEEKRMIAQRRAAEFAALEKNLAESETGVRTTARGELLADLGNAPSLRRAFVLREVLGAPVGLR